MISASSRASKRGSFSRFSAATPLRGRRRFVYQCAAQSAVTYSAFAPHVDFALAFRVNYMIKFSGSLSIFWKITELREFELEQL
jgi:hypothetical protein